MSDTNTAPAAAAPAAEKAAKKSKKVAADGGEKSKNYLQISLGALRLRNKKDLQKYINAEENQDKVRRAAKSEAFVLDHLKEILGEEDTKSFLLGSRGDQRTKVRRVSASNKGAFIRVTPWANTTLGTMVEISYPDADTIVIKRTGKVAEPLRRKADEAPAAPAAEG